MRIRYEGEGGEATRNTFWALLTIVFLVTSLWGVTPRGARAQGAELSRVTAGDSVRVKFPGALWVDGSLRSWRADVMMIGTRGLDAPWPVPVVDLAGLEVHTERTPREGFRHWALLGAMSGLFVGAAVGAILHATGVIDQPGGTTGEIVTDTLKWAGLGLAFGTFAGGAYGAARPGAGWVEVTLPRF